MPCGKTSLGLPVGLQIVGRAQDDIGVLKMAKAYEDSIEYRVTIPKL